jgi:hypothetical protein
MPNVRERTPLSSRTFSRGQGLQHVPDGRIALFAREARANERGTFLQRIHTSPKRKRGNVLRVPRSGFGLVLGSAASHSLEEFLELLRRKIGVAGNRAHRVGVDRRVAGNRQPRGPVRHYDMLALSSHAVTNPLEYPDRLLGAYAGNSRHVTPLLLPR